MKATAATMLLCCLACTAQPIDYVHIESKVLTDKAKRDLGIFNQAAFTQGMVEIRTSPEQVAALKKDLNAFTLLSHSRPIKADPKWTETYELNREFLSNKVVYAANAIRAATASLVLSDPPSPAEVKACSVLDMIGTKEFKDAFVSKCQMKRIEVILKEIWIDSEEDGDSDTMEILPTFEVAVGDRHVTVIPSRIIEGVKVHEWHIANDYPVRHASVAEDVSIDFTILEDDGEALRTQTQRIIDQFGKKVGSGLALELPTDRLKSIDSVLTPWLGVIDWGYDIGLSTWALFSRTDVVCDSLRVDLLKDDLFRPSQSTASPRSVSILDGNNKEQSLDDIKDMSTLIQTVLLNRRLRFTIEAVRAGLCSIRLAVDIAYDVP